MQKVYSLMGTFVLARNDTSLDAHACLQNY